ncbi:MAG: DUF4105 domain-containing protein [Planctomycetaceae bacterium]
MAVLKNIARRLTGIAVWILVPALFLWAVGAIYYLRPLPAWFRQPLAFLLLATAVIGLLRMRPHSRWLVFAGAASGIIYLLTWLQQPSNDRDWAADNQRTATVRVADDNVHIANFRHTVFRSADDCDVHYSDLTFHLSELDRVWFVVQRFTALEGIAHNFLTFSRTTPEGQRFFSVSVEIRRERGEEFDPLKGLYRQYELIYVIADERDAIGSRTVIRPDDRVYLFPVNATAQDVQNLFVDIAGRVNRLQQQPEFYHSLLNNCTNNIVLHAYRFTAHPISSFDPRIIAPGFADRLACAQGLIGSPGESFADLRHRCRIDEIARAVGLTEAFSTRIRSLQQPE